MDAKLDFMGFMYDFAPLDATKHIRQSCQICGELTRTKNFGAVACRACAAFFRRTFKEQKQYRCKGSKRCFVATRRNIHHKVACKHCRLLRCLEIGMRVTEKSELSGNVPSSPESFCESIGDAATELDGVVAFRRLLFLNRIKSALRLGHQPHTIGSVANKYTLNTSFEVEKEVLRDFLSTIMTSSNGAYLCDEWNARDIADYFAPAWMFFEHVLTTARNNGHGKNSFYFLDDTHCQVTIDKVEGFWQTVPEISDTPTVARLFTETYSEVLPLANAFKLGDFDDVETSGILLLLFAYYAAYLFTSAKSNAQFVDAILKQLRQYYDGMSTDFSERLDVLTRFLGEFHKSFYAYCQAYVACDLLAYNGPGSMCCLSGYKQWKEINARVMLYRAGC